MDPIGPSIGLNISNAIQVSKLIEEQYDNFDSFIVVCGFDTLCYLATATSFILENNSKLVFKALHRLFLQGVIFHWKKCELMESAI